MTGCAGAVKSGGGRAWRGRNRISPWRLRRELHQKPCSDCRPDGRRTNQTENARRVIERSGGAADIFASDRGLVRDHFRNSAERPGGKQTVRSSAAARQSSGSLSTWRTRSAGCSVSSGIDCRRGQIRHPLTSGCAQSLMQTQIRLRCVETAPHRASQPHVKQGGVNFGCLQGVKVPCRLTPGRGAGWRTGARSVLPPCPDISTALTPEPYRRFEWPLSGCLFFGKRRRVLGRSEPKLLNTARDMNWQETRNAAFGRSSTDPSQTSTPTGFRKCNFCKVDIFEVSVAEVFFIMTGVWSPILRLGISLLLPLCKRWRPTRAYCSEVSREEGAGGGLADFHRISPAEFIGVGVKVGPQPFQQ